MVVQDKPNYRDVSHGEAGTADRKQRLRERFEVMKKLGQGTYGKVQLAINKETRQEVAIKTIKKAKIENEQDLVRIRREIQIMSSIHHPHIIHIYEVFENQEKIVLIMQYASGGELYDYLGCRKKLEENEARRVFRQVASAIFYCHKNRICHRDLKLENILLDDRGNAKIADFGLSNVFDEKYKLKTFCGSPLYASPEIVRGTPYSGPEVDCWSLGVLLYTLVYGAMPFDGSNFKRLVKQISEGEYFEPKEKSGASGLIRRLLTVDINHRATIRDICSDWWVNQGYDHSLLKVAGDMANLTPVRMDLLQALSSAASQAADQSPKSQAITTTESTENKNLICNGYYSKSHPLHVPENLGNRKRNAITADDYSVYSNGSFTKDFGKQQTSAVVDKSKECKEELFSQKNGYEYFPPAEVKKMPGVKEQTADKNESNTFIIVQDLLKDVISKVEQHINTSKMEFLRSTSKKQTQEKSLGDYSSSQVKVTSQKRNVHDDAMECEDTSNTLTEESKSQLLQNSSDVKNSKSSFQQSGVKTTVKNAMDRNALIEASKVQDIYNGTNEVGMDHLPEKTQQVQRDIFGIRRNSIPNKIADLSSRKSVGKLMEPDVVIPIFNVCSNIPKRSSNQVRPPVRDSYQKDSSLAMQNKLSEPVSKALESGMKSNDQLLPKSESNINSSTSLNRDIASNTNGKNFVSSEIGSQEPTCLKDTLRHGITQSECGTGTMESPPETGEAPKLPPRKRFLIKIPKSSEKDVVSSQSESDDPKKVNCDKKENKVHQEELRMSQDNTKVELQTVEQDHNVRPSMDVRDRKTSICSENEASKISNKTASDPELSPKLSQRKSRRDTSKRSLSFNTKTNLNKEASHIAFERHSGHIGRKGGPEIRENVSENSPNTPSIKRDEAIKDVNQLPQAPSHQNKDSASKQDIIYQNTNGQEGSVNLQVDSDITAAEENKMALNEMKSTSPLTRNGSLQEEEKSRESRCEVNRRHNTESRSISFSKDITEQDTLESMRSRPLVRSKHRSLSRTRAMSLEFESLALMPMRIVGPPKKPPGKVEIPKTFDPTQPVTSPKIEMREIIFIPTACVSENKEKIQKKIEKVKKAAIVIPPRRKSDAGVGSRKKKYTRSKTDFIPRNADLGVSAEDEDSVMYEMEQEAAYREAIFQDGEAQSPENMDDETVPNEMWYSAISPDTESEESEQRFKAFGDQSETFDGFYNENDVTASQNNHLHRHSVDTESGYWTPPEIANGERSVSHVNMKMKDEKIVKRNDNSEKIMLQRAAFRNSKLRMKLSDEGLDMCSLSSSLESGIYSWRQEDMNGKRISPESESAHKILRCAEITSDGSYAPIVRSFKKMTFPPEHSSTSELSENCSVVGDAEKKVAIKKNSRSPQCLKANGSVSTEPIKPSDSQSSYGSNDISDEVFESWVEKEDGVVTNEKYESPENMADDGSTLNVNKRNGRNKKPRNSQLGELWNSYSTDKESSDNDDDLDLMVDESHQVVYGTEGLWQFLKSVNQHLSNQLKTASQKASKLACHRSKSQESKHPDDVESLRRPVTRSLSREEKQRKGGTQLRHFVSEGRLANADSTGCIDDSYQRLDDTRYSSGYMASGSSLNDSGMLQKDFMSSADSFYNHSDDVSLYGTLRRDKYYHSSSALSSPCLTRRKKSLGNLYSSGDLSGMRDNPEDIADDELSKHSALSEQSRRLSLYGTLRPKHLSQQGKAQSQILLSTDDGYQLLYNERSKRDSSSETLHGSLGTLRSSVSKASSELNVKDYEKLLLTDEDSLKRPLHKNTSSADSYHGDKSTSRVKKIISDKGNRRVSFSSDVKSPKSDYHSTIRQNSLNKVREANEELSSSHKNNSYDDEQDSGSLLEALKTYGYRGMISQKLQSSPDAYEPPRMNYRLPTECFLSTGLNMTNWDNVEYVPVENTLSYQQPLYTSLDPMEYYQYKTLNKGSQMKRNVSDYVDFSCDDDIIFKDNYRSHRLIEDDVTTRRKPVHKFQDLLLTHGDHQYAGENWDVKPVHSPRKKSLESGTTSLNSERRNSSTEKILQHERDKDNEELGSTDSRGTKQLENTIETLSEKIQALKSRCQKKSLEESRLKKELDESGAVLNENQDFGKVTGLDSENERVNCHVDPLEAQESESSESVSDRIWRKSFYSRFNDVSTGRKKKSSSFLDSEFMSGHNFLRSSGKFNIDEEGGVEEPWTSTSLKRRNSQFRRSLSKQTVLRASSLNSDAKEYGDCALGYRKQSSSMSDKEYRRTLMSDRSLSQSSTEEQNTSMLCNKKPLSPTKVEADYSVLFQEGRENRTEQTLLIDSSDACPTRISCDKTENQVSENFPICADNIPETKSEITDGGSTADSGNSATELKIQTPSPEVSVSPLSAELKATLEEESGNPKTDVNLKKPSSVEVSDNQKHDDGLEAHEE